MSRFVFLALYFSFLASCFLLLVSCFSFLASRFLLSFLALVFRLNYIIDKIHRFIIHHCAKRNHSTFNNQHSKQILAPYVLPHHQSGLHCSIQAQYVPLTVVEEATRVDDVCTDPQQPFADCGHAPLDPQD